MDLKEENEVDEDLDEIFTDEEEKENEEEDDLDDGYEGGFL